MLNARFIRVGITLVALFCLVGFFATSRTTSINLRPSPKEEVANIPDTKFSNGPYLKHDTKPKVNAEKIPAVEDISGEDMIVDLLKQGQNDKVEADRVNAESNDVEKFNKNHPESTKGEKVDEQDSKDSVDSKGSKDSQVNVTPGEKSYVVMIDAGSSGSRVHAYEFDISVSPPKLLQEKFEMLKPGLSSFDTDTIGAAKSLDELLDAAIAFIPKNKHACTPIAVKATAGLRKLGDAKANAILDQVRKHLEDDYPFAVVEGDGISVMEGRDEGVYAWITTNYLLGNIGSAEKLPTAAVFDLGGGSTQIVFEPEFKQDEKMLDGEHKYEFEFGDRKFSLYQYSHLGYGLNEGRNKMNVLAIADFVSKNKDIPKYSNQKDAKEAIKEGKSKFTVPNPCVPPTTTLDNVIVEVTKDEFYVINFEGPPTSGGAQCRFLAEKVLNKAGKCTQEPCSFNGVHQPSLNRAFQKSSDMFVFSYFFDRTNPLGFPSSFTVEELHDLAKLVCSGEESWAKYLLDEPVSVLKDTPEWCADLSFISALVHNGYDIPYNRELRTTDKINGNEIGWCLGASLPLLDKKSGWKCRVTG